MLMFAALSKLTTIKCQAPSLTVAVCVFSARCVPSDIPESIFEELKRIWYPGNAPPAGFPYAIIAFVDPTVDVFIHTAMDQFPVPGWNCVTSACESDCEDAPTKFAALPTFPATNVTP